MHFNDHSSTCHYAIIHEHSYWVVHEQHKNPLHQRNRWWSGFFCRSWTCFLWPSLNKIVGQEPLLLVHERLYGIVPELAFISVAEHPEIRWLTTWWMNKQTDGWMNESPPVFYRTSSPSGLLPKRLISDLIGLVSDLRVLISGLGGLVSCLRELIQGSVDLWSR